MSDWILPLVALGLFVWAVVATAAAVEAQERCVRAQEQVRRLLREVHGERAA